MDGELPVVFDFKRPKARKEYICYECKKNIAVGEKYCVSSGYWTDSGWGRFRTCEGCEEQRQETEDPDFGIAAFGNLSEWVEEYYR